MSGWWGYKHFMTTCTGYDHCTSDFTRNTSYYNVYHSIFFLIAVGVALGMSILELDHAVETGLTFQEKGYKKVSPHFITRILLNMAAGQISLKYGFQVNIKHNERMLHQIYLVCHGSLLTLVLLRPYIYVFNSFQIE